MKRFTALMGVLALASCERSDQVVEAQSSALSPAPKRLLHDDPPGGCNDRDYTGDGDWYPNACKTECAAPLIGLSSSFAAQGNCSLSPTVAFLDPPPGPGPDPAYSSIPFHFEGFTHRLACGDSSSPSVLLGSGYTLRFVTSNDQHSPNVGYDWASGLRKGECDNGSAITAVASDHYWHGDNSCCVGLICLSHYDSTKRVYGVTGARCSPLASPPGMRAVASNCQVLDFSNTSVNEAGGGTSWAGEDWDFGFLKAQCGPGRYIKGIAHPQFANGSDRATKILCCSAQYVSP